MESNIKIAAEQLLKIAERLEKEASDNTFFVCDKCSHTASLAEINFKRKQACEQYKLENIANVTVNDNIACIACGGKMSYVPTEVSNKYYVEDDEDGSDIFEPVDEQNNKDENIPEEVKEEVPGDEMPENKEEVSDSSPEVSPEVAPETEVPEENKEEGLNNTEDKVEDKVEESTDEEVPSEKEDEAVIEETVPEEAKEVSDEEDKEDDEDDEDEDEDIIIPKSEPPKFEKIPKEALDDFLKSVAKYSI